MVFFVKKQRKRTKAPLGEAFGRWTVISEADSETKHRKMLCVCICGKEGTIALSSLRSGTSSGCKECKECSTESL